MKEMGSSGRSVRTASTTRTSVELSCLSSRYSSSWLLEGRLFVAMVACSILLVYGRGTTCPVAPPWRHDILSCSILDC